MSDQEIERLTVDRDSWRRTAETLQRQLTETREALTLERFQQVDLDRCNEGFRHSVSAWSLLEWAGAMCGEAGEAANVCKKLLRQKQKNGGTWAAKDPEEKVLLGELSEEIGDVLAYLSLLASAAGLDLEKCVALKFDRVSEEAGWDGPRLSRAALGVKGGGA